MNLVLSRVIVFARDLPRLAASYRDVLGLPERPAPDDPHTWREFAAGTCTVALHNGGAATTGRPPKLVFYVPDVAVAQAEPNARGTNFGRVVQAGDFTSGTDPEGNVPSLSNRV